MCDYSLQHVASRAAKVQDRLITATFPNSITRGFAAIGEPGVAVCLMPGTEIAFDNDVECQSAFRLFRPRKIGQRLARFRQVDANQPSAHHDALEFPDGQVVLVTRLRPGQTATVLQLPATARPELKLEPKPEPKLEHKLEHKPAVAERSEIAGEPA